MKIKNMKLVFLQLYLSLLIANNLEAHPTLGQLIYTNTPLFFFGSILASFVKYFVLKRKFQIKQNFAFKLMIVQILEVVIMMISFFIVLNFNVSIFQFSGYIEILIIYMVLSFLANLILIQFHSNKFFEIISKNFGIVFFLLIIFPIILVFLYLLANFLNINVYF